MNRSTDVLPVLWVFGPPGVGKTSVAWRVFEDLQRRNVVVAFVDIDQLGMSFPEPMEDPGRHRLQTANLAALVDTFRRAGGECLVVAGVVDADRGVDTDRLAGAAVTWCRLRAGRAQLVRRLDDRGETRYDLDDLWWEAELLDRSTAIDATVIDTSDLDLEQVVRRVHHSLAGWPDTTARSRTEFRVPHPEAADSPGTALWLCGATGVGKSTVGFRIFQHLVDSGSTAAFVDLDQLGFLAPAPVDVEHHRLKARNLAALWRHHAATGVTHLVVVGPAGSASDVEIYRHALPEVTFTVARLHADADALSDRIGQRARGQGWAQPGDPIRGRSPDVLRTITRAAVVDSETLAASEVGDIVVGTTGRAVSEVVEAVLARTRWP